MNTLPFILSSIAVAAVAGCATTDNPIWALNPPAVSAPAPAKGLAPEAAVPTYSVGAAGTTVVVPTASAGGTAAIPAAAAAAPPPSLRAGLGRIEAIEIPTDASGATAKKNPVKRITMRMDDGTLQYFQTKVKATVGDRIEVTSNGTMRRA
jgi:hypothetical protein